MSHRAQSPVKTIKGGARKTESATEQCRPNLEKLAAPLPADIHSLRACYFAFSGAANAMLAILNQPRSEECSQSVDDWRHAILLRKEEAATLMRSLTAEDEWELQAQWEVLVDFATISFEDSSDTLGLSTLALHFEAERQRLADVAKRAA